MFFSLTVRLQHTLYYIPCYITNSIAFKSQYYFTSIMANLSMNYIIISFVQFNEPAVFQWVGETTKYELIKHVYIRVTSLSIVIASE